MTTLLCADSESLRNPRLLGIDETCFNSGVLKTSSSAESARSIARSEVNLRDVWVCGTDDCDALNLAATIKHDRDDLQVRILTNDISGSKVSKADRAGISDVLSIKDFAKWYYKSLGDIKNVNRPIVDSQQVCAGKTPFQGGVQSFENQRTTSNCWVACMIGTNGGCGKSSIASTFASLVSALEKRTLLLDADVVFGNMKHIVKCGKSASITEVQGDNNKLADLAEGSDRGVPSIISASEMIEEADEEKAHVVEVVRVARSYFDCIVVNTGNVVDDMLLDLIDEANANIFILDQRQGCIENMQKFRTLISKMNMSEQSFKYVLNRCEKHSSYRPTDIESALLVDEVFEIDEGGECVEELLGNGEMLTLLEDKNPLAKSVFDLICNIYPPCISNKKSKSKKGR